MKSRRSARNCDLLMVTSPAGLMLTQRPRVFTYSTQWPTLRALLVDLMIGGPSDDSPSWKSSA
jgi:hypothetical protein